MNDQRPCPRKKNTVPLAFAMRVIARALRALANKGLNVQGFRICRFTAWVCALRARRTLWICFQGASRAFRHFIQNLKKVSFFYSKRAPSSAKTEVLHENLKADLQL